VRRRHLRIGAAALAGGALSLVPATAGEAYSIGGQGWPGTTVTYYTAAKAYSAPVKRAARVINRAGVGVRLRRASRADADVVLAYGGRACEGEAFVGFQRFVSDVVYLGRGCSHGLVTLTAVHEFGHVLGLDHETRRCARMNPAFDTSGTPDRCRPHPLSYWLAHPLTRDDLLGLRAIYGS
jgi:hypothetical protein